MCVAARVVCLGDCTKCSISMHMFMTHVCTSEGKRPKRRIQSRSSSLTASFVLSPLPLPLPRPSAP